MKRRVAAFGIVILIGAGALVALPMRLWNSASATEPIGSLDDPPPPSKAAAMEARPGDPPMLVGSAARKEAQLRFEEFVKTIRNVEGSTVGAGRFYTAPRFTGYPGLCAADVYDMHLQSPSPAITVQTVFRLIGSTEAPGPWTGGPIDAKSENYDARATANCEARTVSRKWFMGNNGQEVWTALRLVDTVIMALRSFRPLPFNIEYKGNNSALFNQTKNLLSAASPKNVSVRVTMEGTKGLIHKLTEVDLRDDRKKYLPINIHEYIPVGPESYNKKTKVVVEFFEPPPPLIE